MERFLRRAAFDSDTECLEWTGHIGANGYGRICIKGIAKIVSRMAWQEYYSVELPADLFVLHHCDNRKCFNISHLFVGTKKDNIRDMDLKKRNVRGRGERNGHAVLTNQQVIEIKNSRMSNREISDKYGIRMLAAWRISKCITWKFLGESNDN